MNLLEVQNVSKRYGAFKALDDVSITLTSGKIVGLLGSNGSGKTTLIKCINQLLTLDYGRILLQGQPLQTSSKALISYLPERSYFNPSMKVKQAIQYFSDFYSDFDAQQAYQLIETWKIDTNKSFKALSKGTREKVQLALTMSRKATLYILDEPIGGVDPASRDQILNTILSHLSDDATLLISTHLIQDIEHILDDVIFIQNGKIICQQNADALRDEHQKSIDQIFREVFR